MRRFLQTESIGGALLVACAVVAVAWANAAPHAYADVWSDDVRHAIDTWLLPVFFVVVGIEIRRELDHPREAIAPVVAAAGGMVVPALLYVAIAGTQGWAVPMATDVAFAVGVLTLVGPRVPTALKVFLLMLAVADDLGSVVVIGLFFGGGIQPTVVAALVGIALPRVLAERIETPLHALSTFVVVPLFALANAGVHVGSGVDRQVAVGVVVARVAGKVLGITAAAWLVVRAGLARLPDDVTWPMIAGVGLLGGMGFTVAMYVADRSFVDPTGAKVGVLLAAALSGVLGGAVVARATR